MTTTESDTCFHAALDAEDATHPEGDFAKQTETPAAHETDEDNHLSGVKVRALGAPVSASGAQFIVRPDKRTVELTTTPRARHPATFEAGDEQESARGSCTAERGRRRQSLQHGHHAIQGQVRRASVASTSLFNHHPRTTHVWA